jgi:uncharacterized protein YfaS (alpha-2-macroglobulin family)
VTELVTTLLILFILVCAAGCTSNQQSVEEKKINVTAKTAEVVSHITTGPIHSKESIILRFVHPEIAEDQVGSSVEKEVFHFEPGIEGAVTWRDRRTLVFKPSKPLPFYRRFRGQASYGGLLPKYKDMEPVQLRFEVMGREIINMNADFEPVKRNNPSRVRCEGKIGFSEDTSLELLKKAVTFSGEKKKISLEWTVQKEGRVFKFVSQPIRRTAKTRYYRFKVNKKKAELPQKYERVIELAPLKTLKVMDFRKFDQGEQPGIEITFSDELDPRQDKTGLIRVERDKAVDASAPHIETNVKTLKKSIYVEGNFAYGESFTIKIAGIKSKWGAKLKEEYEKTFDFEDKKPEMSFLSSGVFLPSTNNRKIGFKTINLARVRVEIKKVFESNLGQFLQTEKISSRRKRHEAFNHQYVYRVGVWVASKKLEIGKTKNKWLTHELDLSKLIQPGEKGLFLVRLYFNRGDILYNGPKKNYYPGREYYNNPNSHGYTYRHGNIYKPAAVSDIGLMYKRGKGGKQHMVFATDLVSAKPMEDVKVTMRTFQNQELRSGRTGGDGKIVFKENNQQVFYIEGEKNGQRSFIVPKIMGWNLSSFDTGGTEESGDHTRAYIYSERGVYRPGDRVNLAIIVRNHDNSFPDNHPVTLRVFNPKNQVIYNKTQTGGKDGFYSFRFSTKPEDMTGNWRAEFQAGSRTFSHTLKIETVAPYRLKVNIEAKQKELFPRDEKLAFSVESKYLFGSPAASLKANVTVTLMHSLLSFSRFPGFSFNNEAVTFKNVQARLFDDSLDEQGKAKLEWSLPDAGGAPSGLKAQITAKVFEKGGRASRGDRMITVHPFSSYIGLQKPKSRVRPGLHVAIPAVLVNGKGEPLAGRQLKYKIFKNSRYWWWEYDNVKNFRVRFKNDRHTRQVKEGLVTTAKVPVEIKYMPDRWGEYLIEVQEAGGTGHKAGFFFSSRYYGYSGGPDNENVGTLVLGADKQVYKPGDTAIVNMPHPGKGLVTVSLEKSANILRTWVYNTEDLDTTGDKKKKLLVEIPVSKAMLPNAYVSVSILQPHSQTANDRPLRMYGVLPLMVKDPATEHALTISMADKLKSNESFGVEIKSPDGKPAQFTIAVVDEGLLDITGFRTPNPWRHFFKKQRLSTFTSDLYHYVIGAHKGDIFRLFSVGGDMDTEEAYRASQLDRGKSKRFKPVSMFKGPLSTDEKGYAKVSFDMPNYIGSVRVMVIAARGGSYGRAEKTVPVKTDLMVLPKLPRVLAAGDKLKVPVSVFAMDEAIKNAEVSIQVEGPLDIIGDSRLKLVFDKPGEKDVLFSLDVRKALGDAVVTVTAVSAQMSVHKKVELRVKANSPRLYDSKTYECPPGRKIDFIIPAIGMPGSNRATVSIVKKPKLNLNHRLGWLIRYPYGCIEQTTSSVFPQLYLKSFLKKSKEDEARIDKNIDGGIQRLRRFLTPSGGFGYWPGKSSAHIWGTNYGFHFIVEAKKLGYHVPKEMLARLLKFQKSRALMETDNLMERAYRLYLLALAGEPQVGPMNLLKENHLEKMPNPAKWFLASAYHLSGRGQVAKSILRKSGIKVDEYRELGGTFGSTLRDQAIILEAATLQEDWQSAELLYDDILDHISGRGWRSTQTLAYSLLAVGKYLDVTNRNVHKERETLAGFITLPGGKKVKFDTAELKFSVPVESGFGETGEVYVNRDSKRAYVLVEWSGVPMDAKVENETKNLGLEVEWLDEFGDRIDPASIKQGVTFWGHFRVRMAGYRTSRLDELALVQVLPSGWEIENTRLLKEQTPPWMEGWNLNREEYLDIRDDRIMWFFDLLNHRTTYDFVVKINAVTVGEFTLPPTLFEAMYDNKYKSVRKGKPVKIINHEGHEEK